MLWSAESGMIARAGGGDKVGGFEKAHALLSDHATGLIFVWTLDQNVSTITVPARCRMRQTTNKANHGQIEKLNGDRYQEETC